LLAQDLEHNIVELGMVSDVFISDGKVYFSITVPAERAKELEPMRLAAERVIKAMPGVKGALVSADRRQEGRRRSGRPPVPNPPHGHAGTITNMITNMITGATPMPRNSRRGPARSAFPALAIIAVASGKGGVGKSTTTANLAVALATLGMKVGVLDADIYGPSVPKIFGITGKPKLVSGRTLPDGGLWAQDHVDRLPRRRGDADDLARADGESAITQMLREVAWGELDVLVVDMPPGTGDAQLTMAQQVPLAGAVIVSTPQDLALIDARRGVAMFRKVEVPILGIVENMSYFICPECGTPLRHLRPWRRAPRGGAAARSLPRRSPARHADPRDLRQRPPDRRVTT
jgi:ATP-binding protein involved in chromosome partitioning